MIVLAWRLPVNHVLTRANDGIATGGTTCADTLCFFEEPDAHFETKIRRGKRANGTNIYGVKRIIIFQPLARMGCQHGVTPAIDEAEHVVVCDFLAKTDAPRAEDAAFIIERDPRPEHNVFWFFDFVLEKTRLGIPVIDAEFLQAAFARLVADWTIERMIDKEKFHHTALTFLHQRRIGANGHAFGHILGAGNLRTRHPIDNRFAISAELGFAIWAEPREPHFDQTHPAIAG